MSYATYPDPPTHAKQRRLNVDDMQEIVAEVLKFQECDTDAQARIERLIRDKRNERVDGYIVIE